MASETRNIPVGRRRELVDQAGGKCANPGCSVTILEIHHIQEWHVYKSHDAEHMIALCPTCHHHAHHGALQISDATLYEWKRIRRKRRSTTAQLWVDTASEIRMVTGSITMATHGDRLSLTSTQDGSTVSFRVVGGDVLQVSLSVTNDRGEPMLTVTDNVIRFHGDEELKFAHRAGKVVLTAPASDAYVPRWLREQVRPFEPDFFGDRYTAAEIEVLRPGVVRVRGCFRGDGGWLVISQTKFMLCAEGRAQPAVIFSDGEGPVLWWSGAPDTSMFGFARTLMKC